MNLLKWIARSAAMMIAATLVASLAYAEEQTPLKVYSAGMFHETNTFSPVPTDYEDFEAIRRDDISGKIGEFGAFGGPSVWRDLTLANNGEFIPGIFVVTAPSAAAPQKAYEQLRDELLADLESQLPVNMVLLHLHGAMIAEGYDDAERDIIEKVRALVGPEVVIGVEMDLHNHITQESMVQADIAVFYKYYPHTDVRAIAFGIMPLTAH